MRNAFIGRLGFLSVTAGLCAALACSKDSNSDGSAPPPVVPITDGGVAAPPELDEYVQKLVERCETVTDDTTTEESLRDAREAYKRGETDLSLSTKGCIRMFIQKSGDIDTFSAVLSAPFGMVFDQETFEVKRTAAMMTWSFGPGGTKEVRGDLDADGFAELKETVIPNVSVVTERLSTKGEVVERTTAKVGEDGRRLEVTEESEEDGKLEVDGKYETARVAQKCTTDPPPGNPPPPSDPPKPASPFPYSPHEVPCTSEQLQKLESLLAKATKGGSECMQATGMLDIRFRMLRQMATTSFDFKCTDDNSFVAANDGGYGNVFPGRALLWINPILFTAVEGEQTATLYHELMHFFFGHDHDIEALADLSTNLAYADRVYACEQLCFSKDANQCHLAACKKKKICEIDTYNFEEKSGKTLKTCSTGHQVGALCRKKPNERQWCTTKAECDAACGGQDCESKSISCDDNCR